MRGLELLARYPALLAQLKDPGVLDGVPHHAHVAGPLRDAPGQGLGVVHMAAREHAHVVVLAQLPAGEAIVRVHQQALGAWEAVLVEIGRVVVDRHYVKAQVPREKSQLRTHR